MTEIDVNDPYAIMVHLSDQCSRDAVRLTIHANQEMVEEDISYDSMMTAMTKGKVIEN